MEREKRSGSGRLLSVPLVVAMALSAVAGGAFTVAMSADNPAQHVDRPGGVALSPSAGPAVSTGADAPTSPTRFFGVTTPSGPYNLAELDQFQVAAGKSPAVLMFSQDWTQGPIRKDLLESIAARRMLPIVTWEPRDYTSPAGAEQPEYSLSRILDGAWDGYIRAWAVSVRDYGRPVGVRFAQQMNGNWFPWAEGVNGNQPGQYAEAWRHTRAIFNEIGATNVVWIWSPNVSYAGSTPLAQLYPGDAQVDWVGVDGYNGGPDLPWGGWVSPDRLFEPTIGEVRTFTEKPLVLTEVASTERGGSKAAWISEFLRAVAERYPVSGFVWVEASREADWQITSSPQAAEAFAAGIAGGRFGPVALPEGGPSRP